MKVTSDGVVELDESTTGDYGCTFPRGSLGLKGYFFIRENIIEMTYKLDKNSFCACWHSAARVWCITQKKK